MTVLADKNRDKIAKCYTNVLSDIFYLYQIKYTT